MAVVQTSPTLLGNISINPQGEYSSGTQYKRLDVVTYNGSGYICIQDCQNKPVTNTAYWYLLVSKGDTYEVTEEDLQRIALQIEEDASSLFNQLVAQKTSEFNENATQKTQDYNDNAEEKVSDFNDNAEEKTSDFNDNAEDKKDDFDENANQKGISFDANYDDKVLLFDGHVTEETQNFDTHVTEQTENFDEHVAEYAERLEAVEDESTDNSEYIKLLEANFEPKAIETPSDNVKLTDSASGRMKNFTTIGKAKQLTSTGKNKLNIEDGILTQYGVTVIISNGKILITGKTTENSVWVKLTNGIAMNSGTPTSSNKPAWWQHSLLTGGQYTFSRIGTASKGLAATLVGESSTTSLMSANATSKTLDLTNSVLSDILIYLGSNGTVVNEEFYIQAVEGETADFDYEGYTNGVASPSPSYQQPLHNVEGNMKIESSNKNMFNPTNIVNLAMLGTGKLGVSGSDKYRGFYTACREGDIFSMSRDKLTNNRFRYSFTNIEPASGVDFFGGIGGNDTTYDNSYKIENIITPPNANYIFLYLSNNADELPNIQLEKNETATSYIEHKGKTITFPLAEGQKMYEGDYLADDGIHHVRYVYEFTGTENLSLSSSQTNRLRYQGDGILPKNCVSNSSAVLCASNHFRGVSANDTNDVPIAVNVISTRNTAGVHICLPLDTEYNTVELFKAWLAQLYENNTPVEIEYDLAEEYIEPYTEAQQTAWNKLQKLETYKNTTIVYTSSDDLSPDADFTYLVDPTVKINSRLDDLEQAVVALNSNN